MTDPTEIRLQVSSGALTFWEVPIVFVERGITNLFSKKNNKSLLETLGHNRYRGLATQLQTQYAASLDKPLGEFLYTLKEGADPTYQRFLNPHGDTQYCHFRMGNSPYQSERGLYCYTLGADVVYVGRSLDPFKKRIDQGYGKIHPKNCYIDGQSTNCHLNALIEKNFGSVRLWVCPIASIETIAELERELIRSVKPIWNVALRN